ncbi:hypothetical protein BpHYR1_013971 [Brachionus plicatilis]|uniref:Uncharacterized protein n=1 Tax=Brachionus plicatilis TaxID=10195 RepID=A0A3M7SSJ2_BRAPC|nr:hypothetical protein BpHYR1_013971 [Brachionus plicatilis]
MSPTSRSLRFKLLRKRLKAVSLMLHEINHEVVCLSPSLVFLSGTHPARHRRHLFSILDCYSRQTLEIKNQFQNDSEAEIEG